MLFSTWETFLTEVAMVFTLPLSFAIQRGEICTMLPIVANKRLFVTKLDKATNKSK